MNLLVPNPPSCSFELSPVVRNGLKPQNGLVRCRNKSLGTQDRSLLSRHVRGSLPCHQKPPPTPGRLRTNSANASSDIEENVPGATGTSSSSSAVAASFAAMTAFTFALVGSASPEREAISSSSSGPDNPSIPRLTGPAPASLSASISAVRRAISASIASSESSSISSCSSDIPSPSSRHKEGAHRPAPGTPYEPIISRKRATSTHQSQTKCALHASFPI
jgi:hypothetical protein